MDVRPLNSYDATYPPPFPLPFCPFPFYTGLRGITPKKML